MPEHKIHHFLSRLLLGECFPTVDKAIDKPAKIMGRAHRKVNHTYWEAFVIGVLESATLKGGIAGCLHVLLDNVCSRHRDFKKFLEAVAEG
ncbi:MAG: hypothetical protein JSV85_07325 [Candidatus Bathyarchaeota archaeon]|nr:MAG: hypothetical protein JSV85_07325 [Candidatus Bathyarchaeota archaeon]